MKERPERLREYLIETHPANAQAAALYGLAQVMLAGGGMFDAYPIANWFVKALGGAAASYQDTVRLWWEAGGE